MKRLQAFLGFWLVLGASLALAKTHIDRRAGIKFLVPFKNARILHGPQISATVAPAGSGNSSGVQYTTAIYAPQNLPQITVAVHAAAGGRINRELADTLAQGNDATARLAVLGLLGADETQGLHHFTFDKESLRGVGDLADDHGIKTKLVLQLVRDRATSVRYRYQTAKDLAGFNTLLGSIKVGRLSKLTYAALPTSSPNALLASIAAVLGVVAFALTIGGAAWLAYRRMARGPDLPSPHGAPPVLGFTSTVASTPIVTEPGELVR